MELSRAKEIINRFAKQKVLVVGDVVLDEYVRGKVERINPEAPVPILHAHEESVMTGGAGNVAKNAAQLGAHAKLLSVTGDDDVAEAIETAAKKEGYTPRLVPDPSRPSIRKIRFMAANQQMLRVDHEQTHPLSADMEQQVIALIQEYATDVDGIIVSDYAKGVITPAIAQTLLDVAQERKIPLGADVKPSRARHFIGATFVAPNLKEGFEFLGINPFGHTEKSREDVAKQLYQEMQATIFLTLSADGIYIYSDATPGKYVPQQHVVQVADTSGAGDTATVVLLLALLAGATEEEAAELANAAGAVIVSKIGAAALTQDELLAMLAKK